MSRHLDTREDIEARIAGNLEHLLEAMRSPEDYPARQQYIDMVMAKGDVLIAMRNRILAERIAV
jgi:hypothetical protein